MAAIQALLLLTEGSTLIPSPPPTHWLWGSHCVPPQLVPVPQQNLPSEGKDLSNLLMSKGDHRGFLHSPLPEALVLGKGRTPGLKEMGVPVSTSQDQVVLP